jgi:hypothetical protein
VLAVACKTAGAPASIADDVPVQILVSKGEEELPVELEKARGAAINARNGEEDRNTLFRAGHHLVRVDGRLSEVGRRNGGSGRRIVRDACFLIWINIYL